VGILDFEIQGNPDYGHVVFKLQPGETILSESGAMAYMSKNMELNSKLMGGPLKALIRKLFTGESLLAGEYTPTGGEGEISFSPSIPGHVGHLNMTGMNTIILQPGAFLACTPGVHINSIFGGLRAIFSGEGLFFLECSGQGELFYNAYGAIIEKEVNGKFIIDTGHVVGWEPTLDWTIKGMGNLFSTFFSGEGLVIEFNGRGKVYMQTRFLGGFTSWLTGYIRG
jgi:uncharacterized protein (TIGR00266 family)